jgi:hypothetical protein
MKTARVKGGVIDDVEGGRRASMPARRDPFAYMQCEAGAFAVQVRQDHGLLARIQVRIEISSKEEEVLRRWLCFDHPPRADDK